MSNEDLVYKALADSRRRQILDFIKDEPKTTGEICEFLKSIDRCTVMQHLNVLENSELVIIKREGRLRWNYLNAVPIQEIYDRWISKYASHSAAVLSRLKRDLERKPVSRRGR